MLAHVHRSNSARARSQQQQQKQPQVGTPDHIRKSLARCSAAVVQFLRPLMKKTGLDFETDMLSIPNLASAICSATSLAHAVLLKSVIVRYFAHHQTLKLTASEFARGYACLVWALCFANRHQLISYLMEVYAGPEQKDNTIEHHKCAMLLEDVFDFDDKSTGCEKAARAILDCLIDYAKAVQMATAPPAIDIGMMACNDAVQAAGDATTTGHCRSKMLSMGKAGRFTGSSDVETLPVTSSDSEDGDFSATLMYAAMSRSSSYNSNCSSQDIPIPIAVRYFKMHSSKLWPLDAIIAQLRYIYFGPAYWQRIASAPMTAVTLPNTDSFIELTNTLRELTDPPPQNATPAQQSPPTSLSPRSRSRIGQMFNMFNNRPGAAPPSAPTAGQEAQAAVS